MTTETHRSHRRALKLSFGMLLLIAGLGAGTAPAYEAKTYCGDSGTWIQILGAGGSELDDSTASASYLVWRDGKARVLVDPGPGASLLFDLAQARYEDLEAIVVTNLEVGNSADLPAFARGALDTPRIEPLRVIGPSGSDAYPDIETFMGRLFGPEGVYPYLSDTLEGRYDGNRMLVTSVPARGRKVWSRFATENLKIGAVPVNHGAVPALAYRVDIGDERIVFTGDFNNEKATLATFAEGAEALIINHSIAESARGRDRDLYIRPSQIGRLAAQIDPRFVILGHRTGRTRGVESLSRQEIEKGYSGSLLFASDMECWGL
ncbi:MAG: MBL fold metallo-hydrolase [Pseudomonadota bacterium]